MIRCDICDSPIKIEYFLTKDKKGNVGRLHQLCLVKAVKDGQIDMSHEIKPVKLENNFIAPILYPHEEKVDEIAKMNWPDIHFGD